MIATTKNGKMLMIPQIRLPIAFPLVSGIPVYGAAEIEDGCTGGNDGGDASGGGALTAPGCGIEVPQFEQNRTVSANEAPH